MNDQAGVLTPPPSPSSNAQPPLTASSNAQFIPLDRIGSVLTDQILALPAIWSARKRKAALGRVIKALQILGLAGANLPLHRVVLGITTLGNGNLALLLTQLPEAIPHPETSPEAPHA